MSKTIGSVVAQLSLGQVLSASSAISLLLADTNVGDKVVGGEGVRRSGEGVRRGSGEGVRGSGEGVRGSGKGGSGSGEGVRGGISASSLRESIVAALGSACDLKQTR